MDNIIAIPLSKVVKDNNLCAEYIDIKLCDSIVKYIPTLAPGCRGEEIK
jgi:hypothetical protein